MSATRPWRLLRDGPARGAWNMAVDEALLESTARGDSPPTLRFYAWEPACLSLGYAQPYRDVDDAALTKHGWEVVRRPTGGRAILHTDELTYSVTGAESEPALAGDILTSYKRLSAALLDGLQRLSVAASAQATKGSGDAEQPVCFEVPGRYEITIDGKKLVGSAQARRHCGVLQHGTLPLHGDLTRITQALVFPDAASRQAAGERLLNKATTVESALGHAVTFDAAADAIIDGFKAMLGLAFELGELTAGERSRAQELLESKYAHPDWLYAK